MKHFLLIFFMVLGGAVGSVKAQVLLDHNFEDGDISSWGGTIGSKIVVNDGANGSAKALEVGVTAAAQVLRPPWASGLNIVNGKYYVSSVYLKDNSGTGAINWRVFAQTPSANVSLGTINSTSSYKKYMFLTDKLPEGADHRFIPQFNQIGTYYLDEMILREAVAFENSGFEDDFFAQDTAQGSATAAFSIETDLANVYEGSKSMKIDVTAAAGHTDASVDFQQKQFVDPLKTYKFSCIIKGVGSVMLRATPYDINGVNLAVSINDYSKYIATISEDYKEQALEFITPASTAYVVLELGFGKATGVRWVDALAFDEITTWTGANSTDWTDAGNWTNGIPSETVSATVPNVANDPVIAANQTADVLNLTVSGIIRIEGNSSSTGSLIVHGTADVQNNTGIIVKPYLTGDPDWHVVSSPVAGLQIESFATYGLNNTAMNSAGTIYAVAGYDELNDNWSSSYTPTGSSDDFVAGMGYVMLDSTSGVVAFRGTLNNGDYTLTLDSSVFGWNALGNPYTSAISISDLLSANSGVLSSSFTAFYLWDAATSKYVIVNSGSTQQQIPVGQGFFVRAKADQLDFDITRDMRVHQTDEVLKSVKSSWPGIDLTVEAGEKTSDTRIIFGENLTKGLDIGYDAGMFKADKEFALYTRLVDDNGVDFGIQALPENYSELVVPVGIDVPEGTEVTFTAKALGLPTNAGAWLEDRAAGVTTRLDESGAFYTTTVTTLKSGVGNFFLHTQNTTTDVDDITNDPLYRVSVNQNDRSIRISTNLDRPGQAKVYDVSGRLHGSLQLQRGAENKLYLDARPGIYMVHIVGGEQTFSEKIFWKN